MPPDPRNPSYPWLKGLGATRRGQDATCNAAGFGLDLYPVLRRLRSWQPGLGELLSLFRSPLLPLASTLLPIEHVEIRDLAEVGVPRRERQPVLASDSRDPNVVFGQRGASGLQGRLDACIFRGGALRRQQESRAGHESSHRLVLSIVGVARFAP